MLSFDAPHCNGSRGVQGVMWVGCRAVLWACTLAPGPGLRSVPALLTPEGRAWLLWVWEMGQGLGWEPFLLLRVNQKDKELCIEVNKHVSKRIRCGKSPVCSPVFMALSFCSMQNWSGRFQSQVPSRQTSRRTPGSRSRTSSCPRLGRVSQPGKRVTQRMTNSCISTKGDPIGLQPVFPSKALEMLIEILLNPRRVVFQDRTFI